MNNDWPEVEIVDLPPLNPEEQDLLDLHSVLNVLNVLHGELTLIGLQLAQDEDLLAPALVLCRKASQDIRAQSRALIFVESFRNFRQSIQVYLQTCLSSHPAWRGNPEVLESVENIESVLSIMDLRSREFLSRLKHPGVWTEHCIADIQSDFREVFAAIEKNSHGRYRIIYNLARQLPTDYYIHFAVEVTSGDSVSLPSVLMDVIRDLIANARKYTAPGGSIAAGLYEDAHMLRFVVRDTGRGIPELEIPEVVKFGRRGSNVGNTRTMGGGFGLTKALFVTKQFKGRMWISSKIDEGTCIRIEIPRPHAT